MKFLPLDAKTIVKSTFTVSEAHLVTIGTLFINGNKPTPVKELFEAVLVQPCVASRLNPWQFWRGVLYGKVGKQVLKVENGLVALPAKIYQNTSVVL